MRISCIGTGYVGLVTGASLANLGHQVLCADIDAGKIALLQRNGLPFYEPGLKEMVDGNRQKGRLRFTADVAEALRSAEVIFICVGTPQQENGSADLSAIFAVVEQAAEIATGVQEGIVFPSVLGSVASGTSRKSVDFRDAQTGQRFRPVLVLKSTVPPGTAAECQKRVNARNGTLDVASNPEFLKQGNAVYDFNHPDKIVVGAQNQKAFEILRKVYGGFLKTYIPYLEMNWETAEMVKYANNAALATKISFINEIANICDRVGGDIKLVSKAIGMDARIGPKFLNAGIGYGGSCFPKDVRALAHTAKTHGYDAKLLQEVDALNERQKQVMVPRIVQKLKEMGGNTITLWGLSFKPKTSDLRGASSLVLIEQLTKEGYNVKVYDPVAMEESRKLMPNTIHYCSSIEESVTGSDAIVLVTEWDEFRNVNFAELGKAMKSKILFDGRNIYDPQQLKDEGFAYYGVGRG